MLMIPRIIIYFITYTRDSWAIKIRELLPYVAASRIVCMVSHQEDISEAKVLVVSYSLMERHIDKILKRKFSFVILVIYQNATNIMLVKFIFKPIFKSQDESHLLKNVKAKSTTAAIELSKRVKRVVLLTGTPALSRPSELFTQLQIIDPLFFSYKEYCEYLFKKMYYH